MVRELTVATPQGDSGKIFSSEQAYLFRYQQEAAATAAVSLLMPVRLEEYRHHGLHPIFQMNLPEGYVLEQLRNRLAKVVNVNPGLLLALSGSSAPIGRVSVTSADIDALLRRQHFPGEKLESILGWDGAEDIFVDLVDRYILRSGISGIQPKVLVPEQVDANVHRFTSKNPDLIVKSGRDEFPGLAINEFLCMSMAKEAGIIVPPFYLSDNAKLFVMRRFDRDERLNPIGFEDMAALMALPAEQKYSKSYAAIAKAIRMYCSPACVASSLEQLFAMVTLSCIVGNGDAHLKNFGLLYSDPLQGDARLAPAYDIVNTTAYIPEDVLALSLAGNKSFFASRQGILDFAQTCDIAQPREVILRQLQAVESVLTKFPDLCERAPQVVKAIRAAAEPYVKTFG